MTFPIFSRALSTVNDRCSRLEAILDSWLLSLTPYLTHHQTPTIRPLYNFHHYTVSMPPATTLHLGYNSPASLPTLPVATSPHSRTVMLLKTSIWTSQSIAHIQNPFGDIWSWVLRPWLFYLPVLISYHSPLHSQWPSHTGFLGIPPIYQAYLGPKAFVSTVLPAWNLLSS